MSKDYTSRITEYRKVKASDLRANPANFRKHPDRQLAALRGSLRTVGRIAPLLAYDDPEHGLTLIDGHARLHESDEWDVAIVDLSPDEARLAITLLDPIAAMAETDKAALESILHSINTDDQDIMQHLDDFATANGIVPTAEPIQDDASVVDKAEELLAKWQVQVGDMWTIGDHTLVCGDCTDAEVVALAMRGRKPFMLVTDPPYGVNYDPGWRNDAQHAGAKSLRGAPGGRAIGKVTNDNCADWQQTYELSGADVAYVWHAPGAIQGVFLQSITLAGYEIRNTIIWAKSNLVIGRGHYHGKHEPCFYAVRKGATARWCGDRKQSTLWEIGKPQKSETGHSTQKPVECMARPIRNHGAKGDLIYDPFCGSGTTLVACQQEGRIGIGIELEPKYCAVILERLTMLGLEAKRGT